MKKILTILLIFLSVTSSLTAITSAISNSPENRNAWFPESHLITDVPYVAQTERNFCVYSCFTMVFNFMGLNTTLDEMLFYGGLGYTHSYNEEVRHPNERIYNRFDFLYHVYGVSEQSWRLTDQNLSEDDRWEQYYTKVKENVTNDFPILTGVDPFSLPSLRNQFKAGEFVWDSMFPSPGYHVILVIGYNDSNQSICYHDPNAGFYGNGNYGNYAWMSSADFRQAHEIIDDYFIIAFIQSSPPLSKTDAFEEAFRKNIENLTGDFPEHWGFHFGINASKRMQLDFSAGKNQSQETSRLYRKYGGTGWNYTVDSWMQRLCSRLDPAHPNIFDIIMAGKEDPFEDIAAGKNHAADFLEHCLIHQSLCENQSVLLRNESKYWHELSEYYTIFLRKGMFLSDLRAVYILSRMEAVVQDIIGIEETIITQT